jgi:hypothetical protein
MDLLDKLTEILNPDDMNSSIKNIINNINKEDLEINLYYQSNLTLNYNDFINIWNNYVYKTIVGYDDMNRIIDNSIDITMGISMNEPELATTLEALFDSHLNGGDDSIIIFYLKNENRLLLMLKSFIPLLNVSSIQLPFWNYIIPYDELGGTFDKYFEENENLCILVVKLNNI